MHFASLFLLIKFYQSFNLIASISSGSNVWPSDFTFWVLFGLFAKALCKLGL